MGPYGLKKVELKFKIKSGYPDYVGHLRNKGSHFAKLSFEYCFLLLSLTDSF